MPATTVAEASWNGSLSFPDDVATTYGFTTSGGPVRLLLRTEPAASVLLDLECSGTLRRAHGVGTVPLRAVATAGTCRVTVRAADDDGSTPIGYTLAAHFSVTASGASP